MNIWASLKNTRLEHIKQIPLLRDLTCLSFASSVNMQKENTIYCISQSYLIIECHFHRSSIPKNTLEKNLPSSFLPAVANEKPNETWVFWFLPEKKESRPHDLAWPASGPFSEGTWAGQTGCGLAAPQQPPRERQGGRDFKCITHFNDRSVVIRTEHCLVIVATYSVKRFK